MIERKEDPKFRLFMVDKRDTETLRPIIMDNIEPGTEIHTDCWKSYSFIEKDGFGIHKTVNHSKNFVDPVSMARTQKIESNWRPLKNRLRRGGVKRKLLYLHLAEYLFMKRYKGKEFETFLECLRETNFEEDFDEERESDYDDDEESEDDMEIDV